MACYCIHPSLISFDMFLKMTLKVSSNLDDKTLITNYINSDHLPYEHSSANKKTIRVNLIIGTSSLFLNLNRSCIFFEILCLRLESILMVLAKIKLGQISLKDSRNFSRMLKFPVIFGIFEASV